LTSQVTIVTLDTIQEQVSEFKELWNNASTPSEKNKAYRLLIDKIVYDREDNGIILEVLYK
jgi:site-specific DNA recombinase